MKSKAAIGITVGLFISLPWLALNYGGQVIAGFPLVSFELFELAARLLPGGVISIAIESLIGLTTTLDIGQTSAVGKTFEMAIAYLLTLLILSGLGGVYAITLQRIRIKWLLRGVIAGLILAGLSIGLVIWGAGIRGVHFLSISWLLLICILWGMGLAWGVESYLTTVSGPEDAGRRWTLGKIAIGSITLSGLFIALGRWSLPKPEASSATGTLTTPQPTEPLPTPPPTKAGFMPVAGTRPEITPIEDFYRVDINLLPPSDLEFIDPNDTLLQRLRQQGGNLDLAVDAYVLFVDGLVNNPLTLSLEDIKSYPVVEQYATLECISNLVGGDLISTTLFQGTRLKDILDTAGLEPGVVDIKFTCVDGYSESLPLDSAMHPETILCYAMGSKPLNQKHGAPLRLYTPNRFGMKNPKWIIKIEAVNEDYLGFWEQRGWSEEAIVQTTSVIDTYNDGGSGRIDVGGIAFAGARGIDSVELRVDEGPWLPAELDRPLSPLTWVLWRTTMELPHGEYTLSVRAMDGTGNLQTAERSKTHPSGATGYHRIEISV